MQQVVEGVPDFHAFLSLQQHLIASHCNFGACMQCRDAHQKEAGLMWQCYDDVIVTLTLLWPHPQIISVRSAQYKFSI